MAAQRAEDMVSKLTCDGKNHVTIFKLFPATNICGHYGAVTLGRLSSQCFCPSSKQTIINVPGKPFADN
jgi:hypothetical protein